MTVVIASPAFGGVPGPRRRYPDRRSGLDPRSSQRCSAADDYR